MFGGEHVDAGFGEIFQTAGVVKIEMREQDVADIVRAETESFDLAARGFAFAQARIDEQRPEHRQACMWAADVFQAVTGVDKNQARAWRFDQQTMGRQMPEQAARGAVEESAAERAMRAAIEMMDTHCRRPRSIGAFDLFAFDESKQIGVDDVRMRREQAVRQTRIGFEHAVLQQLPRKRR